MADFLFQVDGFCPVCELPATFAAKDPWLRDHFLCQTCNAQPRERALFSVLTQLRPNWRELAIHESSPGTAASRRLAELEDTLQVELFNRSNRGTEPTPAAFVLLNLARGVLKELDGIAS